MDHTVSSGALRDDQAHFDYEATDRLMVRVLWWHFIVLLVCTVGIYLFHPADYYPSPFSWRDLGFLEVLAVNAIALMAFLVPSFLRGKGLDRFVFQLIVTTALSLFSFLIVFATGAAIEAHFHIFAVFALVTLYYDWRLAWVVLGLVIIHRLTLNAYEPLWLYHYGRDAFALYAHTFFALLAAVFASIIAMQGRASIVLIGRANELLSRKIGQ